MTIPLKRLDYSSKRKSKKRVLSYCLLFRLVVLLSVSYNANKLAFAQKSAGSNVSQSTESASSGVVNDIRSNEGDQLATCIVDDKTFSKVKEKQQMNNNTKPNASLNHVDESNVNYFENEMNETILGEAAKKKRTRYIPDDRKRFHDLLMSAIFKAKSRNNFGKNRLMSSKTNDGKKNIDPWLFEENPIFAYFSQEKKWYRKYLQVMCSQEGKQRKWAENALRNLGLEEKAARNCQDSEMNWKDDKVDKDENSALDTILYVGCVLILFAILTLNLLYMYLHVIKSSNSTFLHRNTLNQSRSSKILLMALGLLLSRAPVGSDVTVSTQGTYFLNNAPGRYLEGHVYKSFVVSTLFECQMKCDTLHLICMSLNYIDNEGRPNICEINNEVQRCALPEEFIVKENSFYIETMPENNNAVTRCRYAQSCLDHFKKGYKRNGFYEIYLHDLHGSTLTVYCDMNSEAGAAWTLVISFSLENAKIPAFKRHPLKTNAPVNENSANWNQYRMTLAMMTHVKSQSTHWRATCSFPTHGVDYTDYVRAKFTDFDVTTFLGKGVCKKVEYVNIRGHQCAHCTSVWWQVVNNAAPHIDSSVSACQFNAINGSIASENNFGCYGVINNNFRCTSGSSSTTNWWFGGYQ